jgi:hypothetical protein
MKFITRFAIAQNSAIIPIPAGKWKGFYLFYTGVNQAGQTLTVALLGSVVMKSKGRQFQMIEIDRLQQIDAQKYGSIAATSGAGAAFNFSAFLPQHVPGDSINCLFVEQDGEMTMELIGTYGATAVVILSGDVSVYGVEAEGIHQYYLQIDQKDFNTVLGNGTQPILGVENFYEIFLAYSANLAEVTVLIDGKAKYSNCTLQGLIDSTNLFNAIETYNATISPLDIQLAGTGDLSEALGDTCSILYRVTTAAIAPLEVVVFSIDYDTVKANSSSLTLQSNVGNKIDQKLRAGKTRTVESLARR